MIAGGSNEAVPRPRSDFLCRRCGRTFHSPTRAQRTRLARTARPGGVFRGHLEARASHNWRLRPRERRSRRRKECGVSWLRWRRLRLRCGGRSRGLICGSRILRSHRRRHNRLGQTRANRRQNRRRSAGRNHEPSGVRSDEGIDCGMTAGPRFAKRIRVSLGIPHVLRDVDIALLEDGSRSVIEVGDRLVVLNQGLIVATSAWTRLCWARKSGSAVVPRSSY